MSTIVQNKNVKWVSVLLIVAGVIMTIAAGVVWGIVTGQLKEENITIGSDGRYAGKVVAGPLTAFDQAEVIKLHSTPDEDSPFYGETYATLGGVVNRHTAAAIELADGDAQLEEAIQARNIQQLQQLEASDEIINEVQQANAAQNQRNTVMNASFLRASLFTSVVSYGVCALVIGLGVLFIAVGVLLYLGIPKPKKVEAEEVEIVVEEEVTA